MESTNDVKLMMGLGLKSNISTSSTDKTFYYQRGLENVDGSKPILVLIHGYPQTWGFQVTPIIRWSNRW